MTPEEIMRSDSPLTVEQMLARESDADLEAALTSIIKKFDDYARSDPYGWDVPTMKLIFPEDFARAKNIQAELRKRRALEDE